MNPIKAVLERFNRTGGVTGSLICGHDGIIIESALSERFNSDELAALASSVSLSVAAACEEFGYLRYTRYQMVANKGTVIIANVGRGLFVAILERDAEPSTVNVNLFQAANEIKKMANLG